MEAARFCFIPLLVKILPKKGERHKGRSPKNAPSSERFFDNPYKTAGWVLLALLALTWQVSELHARSFTLRWDPNPEPHVGGYKIYYQKGTYREPLDGTGADQGASPIVIPIEDLADPSHPRATLTGFEQDTVYHFRMTAYGSGSSATESPFSNVVSNLMIYWPEQGFGVNRESRDTLKVYGIGPPGKQVEIEVNGKSIGRATVNGDALFSKKLDLGHLTEGEIRLAVDFNGVRSRVVAGQLDRTAPELIGARISGASIFLTFSEAGMRNVISESAYRFSPSICFRKSGGSDAIVSAGQTGYRLSMAHIPASQILTLQMSGVADAAGNPLANPSVTLNDGDRDGMPDDWEVSNGLDPSDSEDAGRDPDADGFSNRSEYGSRSDPQDGTSAPIVILETIPKQSAGIAHGLRPAPGATVAVRIKAGRGIDPSAADSVRFTIDDGRQPPYLRTLNHDTVRIVQLNEAPDRAAVSFWAVYDRSLETYMPMGYPVEKIVQVGVTVTDTEGSSVESRPIRFRVHSKTTADLEWQLMPETTPLSPRETGIGGRYDMGIQIAEGDWTGAKIIFNSRDPLLPGFGPLNQIQPVDLAAAEGVGRPLNLVPHTVFDTPVKLFIPCPGETDVSRLGLCCFDGLAWKPACDAAGNVLPGGEGWMKPGSRIDHNDSNPPVIEVQVHHFSGTQAVVFATFDREDEKDDNGSSARFSASCFIGTAAAFTPSTPPARCFLSTLLFLALVSAAGVFFRRRRSRA